MRLLWKPELSSWTQHEELIALLSFVEFSLDQVWDKNSANNIGGPEHGAEEDSQEVSLCDRMRKYFAHFICQLLFWFSERIWHHHKHWVNTALSVDTGLAFSGRKSPRENFIKYGLCHGPRSADNIISMVTRLVVTPAPGAPAVTMLHRSPAHAQIVAAAPPPSCLVLHPGAGRRTSEAGPHSLVTTSRSWHQTLLPMVTGDIIILTWNTPLVLTQAEEVGGHLTDHSATGLKWSQRRAWHQSIIRS